MEERITIKEFLEYFPQIRNQLTTIMLNRLCLLNAGETSWYHPGRNKIEPLIYLDEVTKEKYLLVQGAGVKSWEQFCKYRDNFPIVKAFNSLYCDTKNNG